MKYSMGKVLTICMALAIIAAGTLLVIWSTIGTHVESAFASGITSATDYPVPAGSYPWGTAFDGSGRVWMAMPGCDLAPSCPSSTPPGKLVLFDPNTQNWATVVSLPAGFGQPVFVAVDHTGKVWFTMPVTNSIGRTTISQWAVPTGGAGPWDIAIDSKGIIWFTEHYTNQIASFDPNTHTLWQCLVVRGLGQFYRYAANRRRSAGDEQGRY